MAQGVFGQRLDLAVQYAELLTSEGVVRGMIGPREAPRIWERHLLNCGVLAEAFSEDETVADIGSGAGLPGIALAIVRPQLAVTLVEPLLRRTTFLTEVIEILGLNNVEVVRARAEELHGRRTFDAVTSRAVAPLGRLLDWSVPLARRGGAVVAMKGASAGEEIAGATKVLRRHRVGPATVELYGQGVLTPPTTVVRVLVPDRAS